jgi:hypothetical protein
MLAFFKKISNPAETYLQVLPLSSRASLVGMTHEGVVACALA